MIPDGARITLVVSKQKRSEYIIGRVRLLAKETRKVMIEVLQGALAKYFDLSRFWNDWCNSTLQVLQEPEARSLGGRVAGGITQRLAARLLQQVLRSPAPTPSSTS